MKVYRFSGFTLIELMIVVAVVGLLVALAYPTYLEQMRDTRRADATGALMGLAGVLERAYTSNGNYCDNGGAGGGNTCGVAGTNDTGTPSGYSATSPVDGGTPVYNLTISAMATSTTFTVSATPIVGGPQAGDKCGTLSLDNAGARTVSTAVSVDNCW